MDFKPQPIPVEDQKNFEGFGFNNVLGAGGVVVPGGSTGRAAATSSSSSSGGAGSAGGGEPIGALISTDRSQPLMSEERKVPATDNDPSRV